MKKELDIIHINDVEYPMYCSLLTLEEIQDEFGTVEAFEEKIKIVRENEDGEREILIPDAHALIFGLVAMINEGIEIHNQTSINKMERIDKSIIRDIDDLSLFEVSNVLLNCFMRCFSSKKTATTKKKGTSTRKVNQNQ